MHSFICRNQRRCVYHNDFSIRQKSRRSAYRLSISWRKMPWFVMNRGCYMLGKDCPIAGEFSSAGLGKKFQQIFYRQLLLFFPFHIHDDVTVLHHDQPIAMGNGVTHVVGNIDVVRLFSVTILSVISRTLAAVLGSRAAVCSSRSGLGLFMEAISKVTAWR